MRTQLLALGMALLLVGTAPVADAAAVLKIATVTPEGSDWMKKMRAGAKEIKEATDGRVVIKYYGGGVMGNDKKVLRKIRSGQLQGATFTSGGLAERFPEIQIYGLPLIFRDFAEVDYVRERMDAKIIDGLGDAGFVSFGLAEGGFARFMSNEPVRGLDDLKGRKVWVPEGDKISYEAMERMGLSPVTLPVT
ncbi:MAG: TRAP transporter substrate-binding protein DctP, partial [Pseudomonadota bacterium]